MTFPAFWQVGFPITPGYSTVPQFQAHFSGFLPWSRGPRARASGGSLNTGAILKALSAGGVVGSALYSSALLPTGSLPSFYCRVPLRPSKAPLSSNLK